MGSNGIYWDIRNCQGNCESKIMYSSLYVLRVVPKLNAVHEHWGHNKFGYPQVYCIQRK